MTNITRIRTGGADDGLNGIPIADCIAQRLDEHCNNRFSLKIIHSRPGGDEVDARNESGLGAAVSDSLAGFIKCHQRGRVFSILDSYAEEYGWLASACCFNWSPFKITHLGPRKSNCWDTSSTVEALPFSLASTSCRPGIAT
ncbi:hypothetical protein MKX07_007349 [Trichoderma sp. CBMAI-0711]|nr:hypothetical protein MKX07_007349 [Trichoderma sp. CBMAI-0711]